MVRVSPLKVTFVHPNLGTGCAERLIFDVAIALHNQGLGVEFLTNHFDKTHAIEELQNGKFPARVYGDWLPKSFMGCFQVLFSYIRLLYLVIFYCIFFIFEDKPNLFFVDQNAIAIPVLKYTGINVIYYCRYPNLLANSSGGFIKRLCRKPINWLELYGIKQADFILVNSHYSKFMFDKTFSSVKKEVIVLYPTFAASFQGDLQKAEVKLLHELAPEIIEGVPNDVAFLCLNKFHPYKQLEIAIESMAHLRTLLGGQGWERVHLIMAGGFDPQSKVDAIYFKKLVSLTHRCDLILDVSFVKSPSDKLKAEMLKSCDCVLYTPSNENFALVPLEAMAAGKPVIAVNSGGQSETVEHEVTGYLCDPDASSFAEYMLKFVNKEFGKPMGLKGKLRFENNFSYQKFCDGCMNIVNQCIKTKSD